MSPSITKSRGMWSRRLGESLVDSGHLPADRLPSLIDEARAHKRPFSSVAVSAGVEPAVVLAAMHHLSRLQVVDLYQDRPMTEAVRVVPGELARECCAIGYRMDKGHLDMAFAEPPGPDELRVLSSALGQEVSAVLADPTTIERIIEAAYPSSLPTTDGPPSSPAVPSTTAPVSTGTAPARSGGQAPQHGGSASAHGSSSNGQPSEVPDIDDLLREAVSQGASDLHLTAGSPPAVRINGSIRLLPERPPLKSNQIREMVFAILPQVLRERFEAERELDTSHSIHDVGRFRVNVLMQRGAIGAVLRAIPHEIPPFEALGLPDVMRSFVELQRGLILVTGPTGSGKSTTLASLLDMINRARPVHIVTVEDPIEFIHSHHRAIVNQREVGEDTTSFAEALKHVLRQDPDVILVGELRDLETISTALTAAETGHLVFATLHTQDAAQTIDRIIDVFPTNQQAQIRVQLSTTLVAVVTQQLLLRADGAGRVAAIEVMIATPAIRNLIREAKTHQIPSLMQSGLKHGMQSMDQALAALVKSGYITEAMAGSHCHSEEELRRYLSG
jgi:twitching motility protein PilT